MADLLLLLIPLCFARFVLKIRLRELGFTLGDHQFGFRFLILAMAVFAPILWLNSFNPAMRAEYPLAKVAGLRQLTTLHKFNYSQ